MKNVSIGAGAVAAVSTLLPWYSARSSGMGLSFSSSASGLETGLGPVVLLLSLAGVGMLFAKQVAKFAAGPSALAGILAIVAALSGPKGGGSFSFGGYSASSSAGPAFGVWVAAIASFVAAWAALKASRSEQ